MDPRDKSDATSVSDLPRDSWPCWLGVNAQAQTDGFYNGKTVRIIVGATPGGFYDRWARLLARYIPKYIAGNPNFVVQNMPGAGSVVAANYVYHLAKPDGLTMVMPLNSLHLDQLVGRPRSEIRFAQICLYRQPRKDPDDDVFSRRQPDQVAR